MKKGYGGLNEGGGLRIEGAVRVKSEGSKQEGLGFWSSFDLASLLAQTHNPHRQRCGSGISSGLWNLRN